MHKNNKSYWVKLGNHLYFIGHFKITYKQSIPS